MTGTDESWQAEAKLPWQRSQSARGNRDQAGVFWDATITWRRREEVVGSAMGMLHPSTLSFLHTVQPWTRQECNTTHARLTTGATHLFENPRYVLKKVQPKHPAKRQTNRERPPGFAQRLGFSWPLPAAHQLHKVAG